MISIIDSNNLGKILKTTTYDTDIVTQHNWSPAVFKENTRNNKNFQSINQAVFDIDSGPTINEAKEIFKGLACHILPSKNHMKEKNGLIAERYRVIIKLSKPITTLAEFKHNWNQWYKRWPFIDKACSDPARFYYPSLNQIHVLIGHKLEVNDCTILHESEAVKQPSDLDAGKRGKLTRRTLEFLTNGAAAGHWHGAMLYACHDLKEQGYPMHEAIAKFSSITGELDLHDTHLIEDVYNNRESKYDFNPQEPGPEPLYNRASDLVSASLSYLSDKEVVKGESTGIEGLDRLLGGGRRMGELTVTTAKAKTGKSSLYHFFMHKLLSKGIAVGYASRELNPEEEVLPNILSIDMGKNLWKADITEEVRKEYVKKTSDYPLYFTRGYGTITLEKLEEWIQVLNREQGVKYFFIDHLFYMVPDERYEVISKYIRELKTFTLKYNIHIDVVVQPRTERQGEELAVRGGAVIEQALNNLIVARRVANERCVTEVRLAIARHKLASPGKIYLRYDPETTSFTECEKRNIEPSVEETDD
jgi:KaiC/GvpD/RAD55 family RecA-like ATPase